MGAPAVAPRSRPASRPKSRPRPKPAPRPAGRAATRARPAAPSRGPVGAGASVALLPVNAISGIADSQFVVGMSRGRAWVVVLGVLLTGIVALNVLGLSLSAAGSDTSKKVDELQQQNSVLRARIANRLSTERISQAASALGLAVPAPDAVSYLESRSGDAERAAQRLAAGEIAAGAPAIAPVTPVEPAVTDPATIDPAATDPTAVTPTTSTVDPAATTAPTTPSPVDPALAPTATVP